MYCMYSELPFANRNPLLDESATWCRLPASFLDCAPHLGCIAGSRLHCRTASYTLEDESILAVTGMDPDS